MLTRKQFELLRFIHERLKEAGVPPSFDEMKDALDLRSKSGIHRLITALEERGFIRRLPNRARAIEVIKLPNSVGHGMTSRRGFTPSVIEGNLGRVRAPPRTTAGGPVAVPVMGRIAAGTPVEAIQNKSHVINIPSELLATGDHFALEVRGDSMIDAGILDGDIALIRRTDDRRHRRHRGGLDRRRGGDAQALPPARCLDRAGACQHVLRGAHPAAQPRAHPGQDGRAVPALLIFNRPAPGRRCAGWRRVAAAASLASRRDVSACAGAARIQGRSDPGGRATVIAKPVPARRNSTAPDATRDLAIDHHRGTFGRRIACADDHGGTSAILLEGFRQQDKGDQAAVRQAADAAGLRHR